jgi:hypothetical protein
LAPSREPGSEKGKEPESLADRQEPIAVSGKKAEGHTDTDNTAKMKSQTIVELRGEQQQISDNSKKNEIAVIEGSQVANETAENEAHQTDQSDLSVPVASSGLPSHSVASDSVTNSKTEEVREDTPDKSRRQVSDDTEDKNEKSKSWKKLGLYFTAMPTFGYNRIESNRSDNVMIESVEKISSFSGRRLGIRAEIGADFAISGRAKVFAGVLYYQRKQTIGYVEKTVTNVVQENVSDTTIVYDPQYVLENKTFEYELKNIGVQLGINYTLREGKFLHAAGTGIEFHKALNKLPEQDNPGFGSNPSTYVFYNLYYRIQYPAKGKLKAVFQPTFNYSLYLNQDMNAPFYVKPYGLGLNLGLTYSF